MMTQAASLILLCLGMVLFIYLGHVLAKNKGLNPVFWGVMGGILGPLVIPVIMLIKSKNID